MSSDVATVDLGPSRRWFAVGGAVWVVGLTVAFTVAYAAVDADVDEADGIRGAATLVGLLTVGLASSIWLAVGWARRARRLQYFGAGAGGRAVASVIDEMSPNAILWALGGLVVGGALFALLGFALLGVVVSVVEQAGPFRSLFPRRTDSPARFFVSSLSLAALFGGGLVGLAESLRGRSLRSIRPALYVAAVLMVVAVLATTLSTASADVFRFPS